MRRVFRVAVLAATVAAGLWGLAAGWQRVRSHPYFALREVVVEGVVRLSREQVLRTVGASFGTSLWEVDGSAWQRSLARLPWVSAVRVRREFPGRVVVEIRERRPEAIAVLGRLQYVSRAGRLLGPVEPGEVPALPLLTGLEEGDFRSGGKVVRRALRLARICERRRCVGGISEVHVDRERGFVLVPRRPVIPILVGWSDWTRRIARAEHVLARWAPREPLLESVDASLRRSVLVRFRDSGGQKLTTEHGLSI